MPTEDVFTTRRQRLVLHRVLLLLGAVLAAVAVAE